MSYITFQCYACGKSLKVGAEKAGRKAKCNKCSTILTIPAQSSIPESGPPPVPSSPPQPPGYNPNIPPQTAVERSTDVYPAGPQPEPIYEPDDVAYVAPEDSGRRPQRVAGDYEPYDDEYDEYPRRRGPARPKWHLVKLAMLLCFISACVMAGAYLLHVIGYLLITIPSVQALTGAGTGFNTGETPRILLAISTLIAVGATLTAIVGYVFCMLGPDKKGSFGLSIAVISVAAIEVLLVSILQLPGLFSSNWWGNFYGADSFFGVWFGWLLIQLLFGAEMILFPLVLRAFSLALKRRQHAKGAMVPLILAAAYTGERFLTLIFVYILYAGATSGDPSMAMGWITIILLWIGIFVFIAFIIIYILYLWKTREIIPVR